MRIQLNVKGVLVTTKETSSKDGLKKYHSVSIENNDEAGTLNCSDSVYQDIKSGKFPKYKEYIFEGEYNTDWKMLQINRILPVQK